MSEPTRKNDLIEGDVFRDFIQELKETEKRLLKYDEALSKTAKTMKNEFESANTKTIQGMQKISQLRQKAEQEVKKKRANQKSLHVVQKEMLKLDKQVKTAEAQKIAAYSKENKELQKLRHEKNQINKATRDEIKQAERNKNAYTKLSDASRRYKNESKTLGAELLALEQAGKKNSRVWNETNKRYTQVTAKAKTTDAQLKKLDATVGDNYRSVGNYEKATAKLTSGLKMLAGAAGLGALVSGLGSVTKELSRAENQARLFFNTSREGTKEIAQEATILAKVFDKDVNEVLRSANVISKQFGLSGQESLALINEGFAKGGDVSGELLDNISEYSTQLRLAGLNAEQSISIITQSQQQGVFSDKGIDAIKEATLSLREMTPPAKEALEAIGMSAEQVQKDIASGTKTYFDVIQEISSKTNEVGENTQAAGMILADVFKGAGEDAGDFIFSLGEMNTSLEDLEDQNKGLEGAIQNITREWYEFVFGVEEGTGAIDKFSGIINFVADNLGTIIKTLGRLAALYLIIKARQKFINSGMLDYAKNLFTANKNQKGLNKSMGAGSKSAGKFGKTLKSIGWAALIGVAIELAVAFYDIASGVARARQEEQLYAEFKKKTDKQINTSIERNTKLLDKNLDAIRKRRELGEITEKEALKQSELATAAARDRIQEEQKSINQQIKSQEKILALNQKAVEIVEEASGGFFSADQMRMQSDALGMLGLSLDDLGGEDVINNISEAEAQLKALREAEIQLNNEQENLNGTLEEFGHQLEVNNREKIKAKIKGLDDTTEAAKRLKLELKDIDALLSEGQTLEQIEDEEISQENDRIQRILSERLTMINDAERAGTLTAKEAQDQRAIMQLEALLEQKKVLERYGRDTVEIDREISEARLQISKEFTDKELEELDAANAAKEKRQKEALKMMNDTQKAITSALSNQIDERIALTELEAQAAREQQDYLRTLADNGTIEAQQSITEERERELEALREKERLEKQKATLQLISSGLEVFSTELENGADPASALATTVTTTGALTEFLSGLNFFAKGTDNAPEGAAVVGEEGPEARFSKSGKFLGILGKKGPELTNLKAGDIIKTNPDTEKWMRDSAMVNDVTPMKKDTAGNSYDLLRKDIQKMTNVIQNQPQSTHDVKEVARGLADIITTTNKGSDKRVSKFRVKY